MLTFENVTKKYGDFTAVSNIQLELTEGIYGFLSPNGAGKTTILKMAATLLNTTSGNIYWDGKNILEMGEQYREIIGYMPQQFGYYRDYTAMGYLKYLAALKGLEKRKAVSKIEELLEKVNLLDVKDKKLKTFSGGMIQRVGIAQAMLNNPKILILDEPTAGLDPKERAKFREVLTTYAKGRIVLYSTHIVSDVENIANHIVMLKNHELYFNATADELCHKLEGKVFSTHIDETEYDKFTKEHFVLSSKIERGIIQVRFVKEGDDVVKMNDSWKVEIPNLEDVFLYFYEG